MMRSMNGENLYAKIVLSLATKIAMTMSKDHVACKASVNEMLNTKTRIEITASRCFIKFLLSSGLPAALADL